MDHKLLIAYDINMSREAEYYRYVLNEFLPALQSLGLMMVEGWHTSFGKYPARLFAFRTEEDDNMESILKSQAWKESKEKLLTLVRNYEERVVPAKNRFQFFTPSVASK